MVFWILLVAYSVAASVAWGLSILPNYVAGDMIVFNDNGHWSWFMDERVIVDPVAGTILAGSVASKLGAGGEQRDGNVEVVVYSWGTRSSSQTVLHENLEPDDHDVPSLLIRPDGRYLAVYTTHNVDRLTRWRVSLAPRDGTHWGAEQIFDWSKPTASIGENMVT